jgi:hypothetical protein
MMEAGKREDPLGELMHRAQTGDPAFCGVVEGSGDIAACDSRPPHRLERWIEDLIQETLLAHNVRL